MRVDGIVNRIAVVVVTYNSALVLAACLLALIDAAAGIDLMDVVVVDNGSTDDSILIAEAIAGLPITIVRMGRNAGYAAGFNAGVASLGRKPDAVLLMNPDCRMQPGALARMAESLSIPGRGIIAPRLMNQDGTFQPSLRRMPTVWRAWAEALLGGWAGRIGSLGELIRDPAAHGRPGPAAWATGAALLISWQTIVDVGPWDESFLLYSEETDFILRAADRGWILWYEPHATIVHKGGESRSNPALAALVTINKIKLYERRHGRIDTAAYRLAILFGEFLRAILGRKTARASIAALLLPARRPSSLAELR